MFAFLKLRLRLSRSATPMAPTWSCLRLIFRNARYPLAALTSTAILLLITVTYLSFGAGRVRVPHAYSYAGSKHTDNGNRTDNSVQRTAAAQPQYPLPQAAVPVDPLLETNSAGIRHTTIPSGAHVHGFTVFDNLYLRNGTLYVVASDAERVALPLRERLLSRPVERVGGVGVEATDEQLRFVTPEEASDVLGVHITRIEGVSVILYDPAQFMQHFYHWFGELILGAWRVYSHILLDETRPPTPLPLPARFILPFVGTDEWRDRAGVDGPLMRAAFPGASIEGAGYWRDHAVLGTTVVFEQVVLVNRHAAHKHPFGGLWFKMIAGTMNVSTPHDFWKPVRDALWRNTGAFSMTGSGTLGQDKIGTTTRDIPRVTYISRQSSGRRLDAASHFSLLAALHELEREGVCEVREAVMEGMSVVEQIEVVKGSSILVGVHGNGLTELTDAILQHQLWMPPTPLSTVIEIFLPTGYTFDYELLARNMGHRHYAVWNDTVLTYPAGSYHKGVNFPPGFHGEIPVHGPTVAQIIRERLAEASSLPPRY
ncbi:hypothetical protein C8R47DRAFT_555808 [Mycena vitilis]|nr:hypothetical protein C8R47DRAFT_555808 [Mycena vitilis]